MPILQRLPALQAVDLLAVPVAQAIAALPADLASGIEAAAIDPELADTAAFSEAYGFPLTGGANCIVVTGRRGSDVTFAACIVLASTRLDVNRTVKQLLGARKASFAPMDEAVARTGMEYGGITPIGLPAEWPVYVDSRVSEVPDAVIGAGVRGAKLFLPGPVLAALPHVEVVEGLANPVEA